MKVELTRMIGKLLQWEGEEILGLRQSPQIRASDRHLSGNRAEYRDHPVMKTQLSVLLDLQMTTQKNLEQGQEETVARPEWVEEKSSDREEARHVPDLFHLPWEYQVEVFIHLEDHLLWLRSVISDRQEHGRSRVLKDHVMIEDQDHHLE